ncbi:MAG: hypothetical protein PHY54_06380 [Methylococcales bacterium]|nr:hypothetical protein [Methylococcales bacterium]
MKIKIRKLFRYVCVAASFLVTTDAAYAGVIISGATVLENKTFVINSATSSMVYNPGTFSFGSPLDRSLSTVNYNISGSFDATIWTLDNRGMDWLTISNVSISANGLPSDFQIPNFVTSIISSSSFSGSDDPCFYVPANGSCSGYSSGPSSTINGQLQNGTISFSASVPVGLAYFGGGSTYQINATTAVPVPTAFWLFASAMGFCGIKVRQKNRNHA